MSAESIRNDLLSLLGDAKQQLFYYQELGVELLEREETLANDPHSTQASAPLPHPATRASGPLSSRTPITSADTAAPSSGQEALFEDFKPPAETIARSTENFAQIHADLVDCLRCPLHQDRTNIVHTEGNPRARLMFVGEAPGADEDAQSRPFVGRAGQLLTKIIESIGFKREEVLIGNVNRCRPPGNRPPTTEEADTCKPFLLREIAVAQPQVIVVLGNTAMRNLLETKEGITKLRGHFQNYKGIKVMPTFHPAYLLRDPSKKRETWEDLKKVRDYLDSTAGEQNRER